MTGIGEAAAIAGATASVASAGSSIASGISQNQASKNASEASGKVAAKSTEISAWTAYFHNQMREDLSKRYFSNQQYATETEARLMEFNADSLDRAAGSASQRAAMIENRLEFMKRSGDTEAAVYNASASLVRTLAAGNDQAADQTLDLTEEQIAGFRRKFARVQSTAVAGAAYSGVSGVVSKLLFENEIEAEQTARMMRLQGFDEAMGFRSKARDQRIQGMNLEGQGVQAQINAGMSYIQGVEQLISVEGETTQARIGAIFTRAKANSARLGLVFQPPLLETGETVSGKQYSPSGWSDITKGVQAGFDGTTKLMNYFSKTGGTDTTDYATIMSTPEIPAVGNNAFDSTGGFIFGA